MPLRVRSDTTWAKRRGCIGTQFTAQAKQTRLNVDWRRDTEAGPARLYFEADLFGNASSNFQPGSYQFQLRHAFGQLENLAAGYSFSAFMDNDALPDTLDFEGPGAAPFLLLAQGRYFGKVNKHTNIGLSAEAPQSQITVPSGGGKSTAPNITLRTRYEGDQGMSSSPVSIAASAGTAARERMAIRTDTASISPAA